MVGRRGILKDQMCNMHYMRLRRHGDVNGGLIRIPRVGPCSVDGCERKIECNGLCGAHAQRYYLTGDTQADTPIRDKRIKGEPSPGWVTEKGYHQCFFPEHSNADVSGQVFMHVVVMSDSIGRPLFPDETVHHVNGVKNDNRLENLELWSSSHPPGQRVEDKLAWAREIIDRYEG
jgi:hypothetical protein